MYFWIKNTLKNNNYHTHVHLKCLSFFFFFWGAVCWFSRPGKRHLTMLGQEQVGGVVLSEWWWFSFLLFLILVMWKYSLNYFHCLINLLSSSSCCHNFSSLHGMLQSTFYLFIWAEGGPILKVCGDGRLSIVAINLFVGRQNSFSFKIK
jgi:hypothetical protein